VRLRWQISRRDAAFVRQFVRERLASRFVKVRIQRNVKGGHKPLTRSAFWDVLISCLLTTQQRSGPGSHVARFVGLRPSPLAYRACRSKRCPGDYVRKVLTNHRGIRRAPTIGEQAEANLRVLEGPRWKETLAWLRVLAQGATPAQERQAAHFMAEHFKGIGPKQSRNLLQDLGLTRYEMPIDSRITRWLNKLMAAPKLDAQMLASPKYSDFVMDGIQELCGRAGVYPCVFDAAVFSSFDGDGWERGRIYW
jgi:hypothetical protein